MAYILVGRRGGTVRFEPFENGIIEKESESYSSSVTSNPVEDGADINDHVNNAAGTLNISGVIIGGEGAVNALKAMREFRDVLTYIGMTRMSNLVFTSLKFDRSHKVKNGASFSATLTQIRTTSPEYVPMGMEASMLSQDSGKSSNAQLRRTANAGMKMVASQSVSSSSSAKHAAAYKHSSSNAPLTRITGGYSGMAGY